MGHLNDHCRSDEDGFSRTLVMELLDQLESEPLPHLTPNEHAHLLVLIQTTLEVRSFHVWSPFFPNRLHIHRSTSSAAR